MSVLTNDSLERIKTAIIRKNTLLAEFAAKYSKNVYSDLKLIAKSGLASEYFNIGDEITVDYTYEGQVYEFPWIMVDFKDVVKLDANNQEITRPAIILQAKYATIESIQFDHPEANNADANIQQYGYNRYSQSAYRQWLNSSADKGSWWTAQSETDEAPNQLNTYKGFMAGFGEEFLSLIDPVQVKVATNTVTDSGVTDVMYDKFWLPSIEEMYGSPQVVGIEGTYHPYWKQKTGLTDPNNDENAARVITALDAKSSAQTCRLRSAYRGNSGSVWSVNTPGNLGNYGAGAACRSVPDCAIS